MDPNDIEKTAAECPASPAESKLPKSFSEFYARLCEKTVFIFNPERAERSRMFIKLAKKLSMDYEIDIDIDIFEHPYFVSVELHMGCSYYSGRGIDMLAKLLEESDSMSFFRSKTEPTDFTISMDCFIYDRYVGGKKLPGQG